jgi:outer membrane immunogenic protein
MKRAIATFAILTIFTSFAAAAERPAAFSWTGLYVGAGIGGGAALHEPTLNVAGTSMSFDSIAGQGFLATAIAGYDYRLSRNVVAGVFFDFDVSSISADADIPLLFSSGDHRHSWSIGGRAGYLINPATLIYVSAGYSRASFDFGTLGGFDPIGNVGLHGYFVGFGLETQLAGNWALRGEYRFTQFDPKTVFDDPCGCLGNLDIETSMHTGRALVVYRFNGGPPPAP